MCDLALAPSRRQDRRGRATRSEELLRDSYSDASLGTSSSLTALSATREGKVSTTLPDSLPDSATRSLARGLRSARRVPVARDSCRARHRLLDELVHESSSLLPSPDNISPRYVRDG